MSADALVARLAARPPLTHLDPLDDSLGSLGRVIRTNEGMTPETEQVLANARTRLDALRAALSVLSDPTADTVLIAKVRAIVAGVDVDDLGSEPASYICADAFDEIAALLAGGDR